MDKVKDLLQIATALNLPDMVKELELLEQRSSNPNATVALPIIGEFSSGKTTLLNALTDSKALETATKPTTSSIFEIHFGADQVEAVITSEDGEDKKVSDLTQLKNELIPDSSIVTLHDTSVRVPSSIVLIDTPGISSTNESHKQTLIDFLPNADALLLVVDVNQQVTKTLSNFVKDMSLSNLPLYIVVTKTDTKEEGEVKQAVQYLKENLEFEVEGVCSVSAMNNDLDELYKLFEQIQNSKNVVLNKANAVKVGYIGERLVSFIDDLLKSSVMDDSTLNEQNNKEEELRAIKNGIKRIISSTEGDLEEIGDMYVNKFEEQMSARLDQLVTNPCDNYSQATNALVQQNTSILSNSYVSSISAILANKSRDRNEGELSSLAKSLMSIDLSDINVTITPCNIDLDSLGHENDKVASTITKGALITVAIASLVYVGPAMAATAGGAAGGGVAAAGTAASTTASAATGTAAKVAMGASVLDTATDVGSIVSNRKLRKQLRKESLKKYAEYATKELPKVVTTANETLDGINTQFGDVKTNKGFIENIVHKVNDNFYGKPQRRKAIAEYVDTELLPQFKAQLETIKQFVLSIVSDMLYKEAAETLETKTQAIEELRQTYLNEKEAYDLKINELKEYKNIIINNNQYE